MLGTSHCLIILIIVHVVEVDDHGDSHVYKIYILLFYLLFIQSILFQNHISLQYMYDPYTYSI